MLDVYKVYALCCVVQAPFCLLLVSKEGYHFDYLANGAPAKLSMRVPYVAASLLAAFYVPFVLGEASPVWGKLCFWTHAACTEILFLVSALHGAPFGMEHIALLASTRFLGLLTVCIAARGSPVALSVIHACAYALCVVHVVSYCGQGWALVLAAQALLDALLWLAHKWDKQEEEDVEENAHTFYLACSCVLLHMGYTL